MILKEGGNAIQESTPVKREDVAGVVSAAKLLIPHPLLKNLQANIGSAGFKVESGDIDVMVEASDVVALYKTQGSKDPVKEAKQLLANHFREQGVEAVPNGRNVSIAVKYVEQSTKQGKTAQVDVMVVHDAGIVAPWHQHGPRGSYGDPSFKGSAIFILLNSIGKPLGLKFDAFGAKLLKRDDNSVVARTRDEVAKILLHHGATGNDLNSVSSIMKALANDPRKEEKLAQARGDAAKGLLTLPESVNPGTASWFRNLTNIVSPK